VGVLNSTPLLSSMPNALGNSARFITRHEVVHNKFVVDRLKTKGAIFVEEIDEVPTGKVVIFSAHDADAFLELPSSGTLIVKRLES
jgi:4-hydroxy-3-methylbut-2-enyl diphosphate reductase IspH